jgi:riboflavin synthase alpha subunit
MYDHCTEQGACMTINELRKYKIDIAAIQEARTKSTSQALGAMGITSIPEA